MQKITFLRLLYISVLLFFFLPFLLAGCGGEKGEKGIVGEILGVNQLESYKKTKSKVEDINKKLQDRYDVTE